MTGHGVTARGLGLLGVPVALALALPGPAVSAPPSQPPAQPPCAVGDLRPVTVPAPSPVPVHTPGEMTIGGDALAGNGLTVAPAAPPLPADLAATSWLVADLDTGEVIGACGAHRMLAPASVQKLLLVATVLPKLKTTDTVVVVPEDLDFGAEWDSKTVPLQVGQAYTVEDLFLGLLLRSGNDAANALARVAGGKRGVAGTVADMNAEAHRLGARDTHAATPSGLDGPGQVTSAYDLALIFRAAYKFEDFRRWVRTSTHQLPSGIQIQHDNWAFLEYPGSLGGKAGYTDIARHSYVGAFERDGRRLVATVLGAEIMPARAWQQTVSLLDWGFAQPRGTAVGHLVEPGEVERLLESAEPTPSQSPVAGSIGTVDDGYPAVALWFASGVGAAALGSLTVIVLVGRRRRTAPPGDAPQTEPPAPPESS